MKLKKLNNRPHLNRNSKLNQKYTQLHNLLRELEKMNLGEKLCADVNREIAQLNSAGGQEFARQLKASESSILKHVQEGKDLVPKKHYRNKWFILGMTLLGIPLGVLFGVSLNNLNFFGIGLPVGMAIGLAIGITKDKKAARTGHQLNIDMKY